MENHEALLENALDAVIGMDQEERVIYWNHQAEKIFEWSREEAMGKNLANLIIPERFREAHRRGMKHYLASGEGPILNRRIEIAAIRRDGREFPVELTVSPFEQNGIIRFFSFIRDVSLQKEIEQERVRLLQEARDAVRTRDEFIAVCSHELKTPLTSLVLQSQLTEKRILDGNPNILSKDETLKRTRSSRRQFERLTRLIDDMLDLSRISIGKLHFNFSDFDLHEMIIELAERFNLESLKSEPLHLVGDKDRIEQAITNLLTNAQKYGKGSPISLQVNQTRETVEISVSDQGPGIAPENIERIFQKFERGVASSSVTGMGVGLFLTRTIVEAHGGTIRVESQLEKGSTFRISLPQTQMPSPGV